MIKEYSDLSDKQKIIYIKRSVIEGICLVLPLIVWFSLFFIVASTMIQSGTQNGLQTNSTQITDKEIKSSSIDGSGILLAIGGFGSIVGLMFFGSHIGYRLSDKLGLYTDFELEAAERRLKEIQEKLK